MKNLKDFLNEDGDFNIDFDEDITPDFFEVIGKFIDSLIDEDLTDSTISFINTSINSLIDVILSIEDTELSKNTEQKFYDVIDLLQLNNDMDDETDEIEEGLQVKSRKTNSGRVRSQASKLRGSDKIKYLKRLRINRKKYKVSSVLRHKAKKLGIKYKRTSRAKFLKTRYKSLHKG